MATVSVSSLLSTEIVPENYNRNAVVITNTDITANLYIAFGEDATAGHAFIPPEGNLTFAGDRIAKCAINGLSSLGTIDVNYSTLNAGT